MYEWDENKRLLTIKKHGIDFVDAVEVFENPHLVLDGRSEIERRQIAVGRVGSATIAVIFTLRDDAIRVITARKARKDERIGYEALLAGRNPADEIEH